MQTYTPSAGESIDKTCKTLSDNAALFNDTVVAEFNGISIAATPRDTADALERRWREETDRRRAAYEASPEGRAAKRRADEAARRAAESVKAGIVAFDISDQAAWQAWLDANRDGGYGECCLRYAARWAALMDKRLAEGAVLQEIAEETSHEADTEGITGFMYGAAVSMLGACWRHGEVLRRWHNLKTQLRDEGEKANKSGGVLNPAVVSLGYGTPPNGLGL